MCGIGGMLGQPDKAVLKDMIKLLNHRGPDGNGIFIDENCGFAHTRLAIVDLDGSQQPLYGEGSVAIVNGEIYNFRDLIIENYPYHTAGDSEAILALHSQSRGGNASEHAQWIRLLEGMFSFAIWSDNQLILARDPVGIKPLVRAIAGDSLIFASEHKALRAHELHIPVIDDLALRARIAWEYSLDATTLLEGVHQVRPGSVEVWELIEGVPTMTSNARFESQNINPSNEWNRPEELLETFVVSVQDRLMSDVPLGIVLSGGLDSSLVCAVAREAAQRANQPVPECWTVAESEENPDWIAAELVASKLDLKHNQKILDSDTFHNKLPDLSWHGEDLDVTVLFFQPLFAEMSNSVKVGLCGQGADELHAGYPRYRNLSKHAALINSRLRDLDCSLSNLDGNQWWNKNHMPENHCSSLQEFLQFEIDHGQLSNFQLRLVDRHSMSNGLEVRVPFLGRAHRLASNRLPMNYKLPDKMNEKLALRKAADLTQLPKEIVNRPKLPAGRATTPNLIDEMLVELLPRAAEVAKNYNSMEKALLKQPEIAIGLGLFEAMHIIDEGRKKKVGDISQLLDEVI
ncbi:MAG: asparagine synthase (glutamine-hydrolyzing) [Candidatus Poseidoniaceae archaeon]|jgi:asparagine synthase (glutamine-hydrolysing)|nr:asparagine synthase (glutamine-hydrolyzing) [Candidatus Poseidoniaceae archaeon]